MGAVDDPAVFEQLMGTLPPATAAIVRAADDLIRELDPGVVQVVWPQRHTIGYGVGPKKRSEHYAYLDIYDEHVNFGFNHGAALPDPRGLLEGSGARFRKPRMTSAADLAHDGVAQLLTAARDERASAAQ